MQASSPGRVLVAALAGVALLACASGGTPVADAAPAGCQASKKPTRLTLVRKVGRTVGQLRWRAPLRAPAAARYRVYRNGRTVGQTTKRSMRVRITPGRSYRFRVAVMGTGCGAQKLIRVRLRGPSTPRHVAVGDGSGATVRLTWSPSRRGDAPLAGYRLFRDGRTWGQTKKTSRDIPIASNRSYRFSVAAVDKRGQLSPRSTPVTLQTGHRAPKTPVGVQAVAVDDSTIGVTWEPTTATRGRVSGYRILRDDRVVAQVKGTSAAVGNLAATTTYRFQVQAVDALGYLSDPSASVLARTHDPVPTAGHAHTWLLASTGQSFVDFRANYRSIGFVYPTYFDCTPAGELQGTDDPLVTRWSRARRVLVMPRINCQRTQVVHDILTNPSVRAQWQAGMVDLVDRYGYDGLALDFEAGPAADRAAMTSFVADLAAALHARGKRLTQAVSAKTYDSLTHPRSGIFDYPALAQHVDHLFVMAWGIHWSTSSPGASDDIGWVTAVANYVASQPTPAKFVLGAHLYAMDWPAGGGPSNPGRPMEHADVVALIASVGATPVLDPATDAYHFSYVDSAGTSHEVWFGDASTVNRRMLLARSLGFGGVGFWRLGREDQRLWSDALLAPGAGWL